MTARPRLTRIAEALPVLVLIAAVAILGWNLKRHSDTDRAGRDALAAGQQYAVLLTSVDSHRADQDFAALEAGATGDFRRDSRRTADQLKSVLVQSESVSKGRVVGSSVRAATTSRVELMLFVDAEVTNTTLARPRVDRGRVFMTLDRVDGRWLVSAVEIV